MAAYLTDHKPVRDQWYDRRRNPLTGCTVLHTSEGVMDTVGPDTGTDTLAEFIRTRTTAGSYHDVADSDSNLQLVEYVHGAYHDGTGSNNWALSISFVCRTVDWDLMTPERRRGFLRQGALAFARQQAYRRSIGAPLTELRLISKAQSDRGESGFIYHGLRDPGRRTDPGVAPPNDFPFAEFIAECRAAVGGPVPSQQEDDDMPQAIGDFVPPGEKHTRPIPPPQSGAAGWGRAFLSVAVNRHGADKPGVEPPATFIRVAVQGEDGNWRPAWGADPVLPIRPGTRPVTELRKGDQVIVVAALDKDYGVGWLIEYAPR